MPRGSGEAVRSLPRYARMHAVMSRYGDANEGRVSKNAYNRARRQRLKMDRAGMQPGSSGVGGPRGGLNLANEDHVDINHAEMMCDNDNLADGLHAEDDSHTDGSYAED
ncbi:hypothetical protein MRB53_025011 [Persea americana]|uniref:Uncharacterized protein n=1 Tax=Persea americana TaxID=3435 RepID=A0ACC2LEC2_PERAE|nr:hypothetical protein MRB53_025011 [Persea americana]